MTMDSRTYQIKININFSIKEKVYSVTLRKNHYQIKMKEITLRHRQHRNARSHYPMLPIQGQMLKMLPSNDFCL